MITCQCKTCGQKFQAYQSAVKRGGGKFCSKSCNAKNNGELAKGKKRPAVKRNAPDINIAQHVNNAMAAFWVSK